MPAGYPNLNPLGFNYRLHNRPSFGKYSHRTISSILAFDPGYICWCLANVDGFLLDAEATEALNRVSAHLLQMWEIEEEEESYTWKERE